MADLSPEVEGFPAYMTKEWEHGDYVFYTVREGLCLAYLDAFLDKQPPAPFMDWDLITLTKAEANDGFATNGLVLRENVMLMVAGNSRVNRQLRKRGVEVIEVPFDGPCYWQGGIRCSTTELWRDNGG